MRISLQWPTSETIPSARIPGPVKLERLLGSYPSPSGSAWIWLRYADGVTGARCPIRDNPQLFTLSQFCAFCTLFELEVCLTLSLRWKVLIRLHDPSKDTSHSESAKNEFHVILKRQAALGYPTLPVTLGVLRVLSDCLSPTHGAYMVHRDTFLKIYLHRMNRQQLVLEMQEVLQMHTANV